MSEDNHKYKVGDYDCDLEDSHGRLGTEEMLCNIANELDRLVKLKKIELSSLPVLKEIQTTPEALDDYSKEIDDV